LTLLVGWQKGHPACKKTEWWGSGMVICLERDADLHTARLMPLPLTVSRFSKLQIGFTFLVPAHPGCPGYRACVCRLFHVLTGSIGVQQMSQSLPEGAVRGVEQNAAPAIFTARTPLRTHATSNGSRGIRSMQHSPV